MASPEHHLPKPIAPEKINQLLVSLGLPEAREIVTPAVTATYHAIYLIKLPSPPTAAASTTANAEPSTPPLPSDELILRVAGSHIPVLKTKNEVGVMVWVARHTTTIPLPDVVAYDASTSNLLGHEYTLLSRARGTTLSAIYDTLGQDELDGILDQLIDMLVDLESPRHEWQSICGLNISNDDGGRRGKLSGGGGDVAGTIVPARVVDETYWQTGDLHLWPAGETVDSLNVCGPYESWPAMVSAEVRHYVRLIQVHDKLALMRDVVPRLLAFAEVLLEPERAASLGVGSTRFVLAHKDLHFANMLYADGRITAVLDWEFAGVVPAPLWNPSKAFLWNGQPGEASRAEKQRLVTRFAERVRARGDDEVTRLLLGGHDYVSPEQEAMDRAVNYLRAITEVCPRDQRQELVPTWKATVLESLARFGI